MESLPYYPANIYCFPRRLQRNNSRLPRPLEDVFKTYLQYVFLKRLQDVFKTCLQDVFKTSWKTKKCYTEDVLKTSSVRLHQDKCLLNVCIFFAHAPLNLKLQHTFSGLWFLRWKPRHSHKWLGKYWLISCYT